MRAARHLAIPVLLVAGTLAWVFGGGSRALHGGSPHGDSFRNVTAQAGLRFTYDNDPSPAHRYVETTGGGCAFVDYDNDGRLDLFAVQGGPAPGSPPRARPPCALFRNRGDGTFEDQTGAAGLNIDLGYAQGVAAADYDNDGWTDLLVTGYGGVHLLRNMRGRFQDITRSAGLQEQGEAHWSTSAAWADYDRDGYLDLFICHYASWFPDADPPCFDGDGHRIYCRPLSFPGDASVLYRNRRDGTFEDVTARALPRNNDGKALGALWLDYDMDGWPDLFVTNDMSPNWLLRNQHNGTFSDAAGAAGVATGPAGLAFSGMGIAAAPFFGGDREDVCVANFSRQPRSYFRNLDDGTFGWATSAAGLGDSSQPYLAFGIESLDYDLDGHPDLVIGNGHINEAVDRSGEGVTYREPQQLYRNQGDGRFVEDREAEGDLARPRVTRGLAVGDYNNDGRPDVLVSGPRQPLSLFRNEVPSRGGWIGFRLEGSRSNRDGLGAWVRIRAGGQTQSRYVRSGSSYCSHSDTRLLFGLGRASRVDTAEVTWPSGTAQRLRDLTIGRYYLVREEGECKPDPRLGYERQSHRQQARP